MVKRILSLLLVFCLVLSCGACGSKPANNAGTEARKEIDDGGLRD